MNKTTLKWPLLLFLLVSLFYWKILFTNQFSILTEYEGANQNYAWFHHTIASLRHGIVPLWDAYTHSGSSFIGEMQTGLFDPLKVLVVALPLNRAGLFSPQTYNYFFIFVHFLAACFMFLLVRELGLSRFSALLAGICFSLGGFMGRIGWPDMLDTALWLPLIFLFLLRALKSEDVRPGATYAVVAGALLGLAILGGRLHVVMMHFIVVTSAAAFFAFSWPRSGVASAGGNAAGQKPWSARRFSLCGNRWVWSGTVVGIVAVVGFAAGAVQLLPSLEYSRLASRYISGAVVLPAVQKIPYAYLNEGFWPRSILALLLGFPFNGAVGGGENFGPYFGVLPFVLAVIGIWKNWSNLCVKYLAGLAVLSFFYSLGAFSFLHGLLYSLVPFLWMAREAGRFIFLSQFAMAILAAFGAETLFSASTPAGSLAGFSRLFKWVAIASAVGLAIPAFYGKPDINEWMSLSILYILAGYCLFLYIAGGHRNRPAQFLLVALILCDLNAFNWTIQNKIEVTKAGSNHLEKLLNCRQLAGFLKSRPGLFRVQVLSEWHPNIGDLYGIQTVGGMSATLLTNYERFLNTAPHSVDLLNVRYFVKPRSVAEPGAVYEDDTWKVYANPNCYPRAWVVHETAVEPLAEKLRSRLGEPGFDPHRTALLAAPLGESLETKEGDAAEEVVFENYQAKRLELKVRAGKRGLLVLSEVDYPGWQATVNGAPAHIYKADGLFRGIVVPAGQSRVVLRYVPRSVLAGAILSFLAFSGMLLCGFAFWLNGRRRGPAKEVEKGTRMNAD